MSVVNNLIRALAKEALDERLAELGKTEHDLMPSDIEEILEHVVKSSERYVISYKDYIKNLVGVVGGSITLNF